ncbi:Hypothetical_protein [Hexamita inflata]|uniref:Hypothetical_protein n=1 Tax=Hexamita inflata TaxID=28002 RepID=A0ABP1HT33_9EUKA
MEQNYLYYCRVKERILTKKKYLSSINQRPLKLINSSIPLNYIFINYIFIQIEQNKVEGHEIDKQNHMRSAGILTVDLVGLMTSRTQDLRLALEHCIHHPLFPRDAYSLNSQSQANHFSDQNLNYSFCEESEKEPERIENSSYSTVYSDYETLSKTNTNMSLRDLFGNVALSRINSCQIVFLEDSQ